MVANLTDRQTAECTGGVAVAGEVLGVGCWAGDREVKANTSRTKLKLNIKIYCI